MTIYRISPDFENYCSLELTMKELLLSLGKKIPPKQLMHFYRHNLSLGEHWKDIQADFKPVEGITREPKIPDLTTWVPGTLAVSDNAKNSLPSLKNLGELLPTNTPEGLYWILNCNAVVEADESNSKRTVEQGQVLEIEKLAFPQSSYPNTPVFKSDYDGFRNIFCDDDFKELTEKNGLEGLLFSTDLEGYF